MVNLKFEIIKIIEGIRLCLLSNLIKDNEKYLVVMAIEDRIEKMRTLYHKETWVDKSSLLKDIDDLREISKIYSTEYYK